MCNFNLKHNHFRPLRTGKVAHPRRTVQKIEDVVVIARRVVVNDLVEATGTPVDYPEANLETLQADQDRFLSRFVAIDGTD